MRLGIFGGTFDPIHLGHLALAEQCRDQQSLDEIWFVPAAQPPHKLGTTISAAKARCEMLEFAIAGNSAFRISSIELDRQGPSYTVTTLEQLKTEDDSRELFLLMGADSLQYFPSWRSPQRILELATIVAVNRGDRPLPDLSEMRLACGEIVETRVVTVTMPGIDLSATDIRQRVASKRSIRYFVPRSVEAYIQEHRLYGQSENSV
ncbi:nicotinate-nucleotide adenylyltransferase [Schlesneria paludicola]|uniref:nicotinate-nucleotide adenylyltransferase n=1 Tax=Schlesneria paludicola TaxID=360056 RepID=UPI00029A4E11|nr:nicotinate-nucleotide adenylyltransferase [Schlesneria paludicola]